jgi:hypothetical protein
MLQERNPVQQGQRGCKARRRDRNSQCRTGWGYFPTASPPTPQTKWTIILEVVERESSVSKWPVPSSTISFSPSSRHALISPRRELPHCRHFSKSSACVSRHGLATCYEGCLLETRLRVLELWTRHSFGRLNQCWTFEPRCLQTKQRG